MPWIYLSCQSSARPLRLLDANETSLELNNPGAMVSLFEASSMLFRRDQYCEAGRLLNQAFETLRQLVQEQHPQLISCLLLVITILDGDGLSDLVDMLLQQLHDMSLLDQGAQHPITRISSLLARMHQGRPETTQQALTVISARFDQEVGVDHPQYLRASYNLCWSFVQRHQYNEAKDRLQRLLAAYERLAGTDHICSRQALYALAQVYSAQGELIAARETLEELLHRLHCRFGTEIPISMMAIEARRMLAALHGRQSHPKRMKDILASALEDGQRLLGPKHPIVLLVKHDFEDITELLTVNNC
jgi:tetratricopeptide (TPR) repeat protein